MDVLLIKWTHNLQMDKQAIKWTNKLTDGHVSKWTNKLTHGHICLQMDKQLLVAYLKLFIKFFQNCFYNRRLRLLLLPLN